MLRGKSADFNPSVPLQLIDRDQGLFSKSDGGATSGRDLKPLPVSLLYLLHNVLVNQPIQYPPHTPSSSWLMSNSTMSNFIKQQFSIGPTFVSAHSSISQVLTNSQQRPSNRWRWGFLLRRCSQCTCCVPSRRHRRHVLLLYYVLWWTRVALLTFLMENALLTEGRPSV